MLDYDNIKRSVPLRTILGQYGVAHPERKSFIVRCPLHSERTPSFSVDDELFFCFGCNTGGSVIDFVAAIEKISFKEAARKLAETYGVKELDVSTRNVLDSKSILWKMQRLRERGSGDSNEVGELPDTTELSEGYRGLSADAIKHWGLRETDKGVYVPIHSVAGRLIGYSVRQREGHHPKYLNSRGNIKDTCFGLRENGSEIQKQGYAIITEGPFDAIRTWDRGIKSVVALLGSNMTDAQAHSLLPYTTKLYLMLDGDEAGARASAAIQAKWGGVFDILTISLPSGKDPAECSQAELLTALRGVDG